MDEVLVKEEENSSEEEKNSLLDFMVIQNKQYAFVRYISGDRTDEINCLRLFKEKGNSHFPG